MRRHVVDTNRITATPFLAALVVGTTCPPASAQSEDRVAAASALFDEAKAMMDKGNFVEACPKLAESDALDPQVGTLLNLALCYELSGKTGSGCAMWRRAEAAAARKLQPEREELARDRAAKVCARAPLIAIDVAPQAGRDRVEVKINDVPLPREQWNTPQPFDPGAYQLRAEGTGLRPWSSTVVVDEQHPAVVLVPVLAHESDALAPSPTPASDGRASSRLMMGAWIAGGVGVAALGIGSAFGVAALINDDAATRGNNCVRNNCNPSGEGDRQRAIDDARVADVMLGMSTAAAATGIALWLVGAHVRQARSVYVHPALASNAWALSVGEVW